MPIHPGYEIEESLVEREEFIHLSASRKPNARRKGFVGLPFKSTVRPTCLSMRLACVHPEHAAEEMDKKYMGHYGT